ncbi:MAG: FHA domain-containing protein [Deltaproteobacteria bacterium]|nr:FHA domain-containing protein [Deltaproteobacteria bacterium]
MAIVALTNQVEEWLKSTDPVPIADVKDLAHTYSVAQIGDHLGHAFLLLRAPLLGGRIRSTVSRNVADIMKGAEAGPPPLSDARVFFLRPTGRSAFPHFISVGRIQNNDVVLDDASVTKFHAFFRVDGEHMTLCDAGSHNGTFADKKRVPGKDAKETFVPKNGSVLRFGTVELTFLDAQGLYDVLRSV